MPSAPTPCVFTIYWDVADEPRAALKLRVYQCMVSCSSRASKSAAHIVATLLLIVVLGAAFARSDRSRSIVGSAHPKTVHARPRPLDVVGETCPIMPVASGTTHLSGGARTSLDSPPRADIDEYEEAILESLALGWSFCRSSACESAHDAFETAFQRKPSTRLMCYFMDSVGGVDGVGRMLRCRSLKMRSACIRIFELAQRENPVKVSLFGTLETACAQFEARHFQECFESCVDAKPLAPHYAVTRELSEAACRFLRAMASGRYDHEFPSGPEPFFNDMLAKIAEWRKISPESTLPFAYVTTSDPP